MTRALVLGGGGPVGVAWEAGLLAGLADGGVDVGAADRIVGTSAGSIVGARLAQGGQPADLFDTSVVALGGAGGAVPEVAPDALMAVGMAMFEAMIGSRPREEVVADLGRLALAAETMSEDDFVALVGADLGDGSWPERDFACTAFDTGDGSFQVWDAAAGVPLDRAVASSCSVPGIFPPITIGGRRYVDGGVLSATNGRLAAGHDVVVIVSVVTRMIPGMEEHLRGPLDGEVTALEAAGASVEVIEFDDLTQQTAAGNLMDFSTAPDLAKTGRAQGEAEAERIAAVWG